MRSLDLILDFIFDYASLLFWLVVFAGIAVFIYKMTLIKKENIADDALIEQQLQTTRDAQEIEIESMCDTGISEIVSSVNSRMYVKCNNGSGSYFEDLRK